MDMSNYKVANEIFESFAKAVAAADLAKVEVFGIRENRAVWTPAPAVSRKKARMYRERLAAYRCQEDAKVGA